MVVDVVAGVVTSIVAEASAAPWASVVLRATTRAWSLLKLMMSPCTQTAEPLALTMVGPAVVTWTQI